MEDRSDSDRRWALPEVGLRRLEFGSIASFLLITACGDCSGLDEFEPPPSSPMAAWLAIRDGGFCNDAYNEFVNLCGDVEFCFDTDILRSYPAGLSVDIGFHWDGASGHLVDIGGDCDGKRLTLIVDVDGTLRQNGFVGAPVLLGHLDPGTHLVSYRADRAKSALFVDGILADLGTGTSTTPELLAECGPGLTLGQRLSYWWQEGKRESWLRFAPFFFHLRASVGDGVDVWDLGTATTRGEDSVVLFEPSGAEGAEWRDSVRGKVGLGVNGSEYRSQIFEGCLSGNRPPGPPTVRITPALPEDGQSLLCQVSEPAVDRDGDVVAYSYAWLRNGVPTSSAEAQLPAGVVKTGDTWTCVVTPTDGVAEGKSGEAIVQVSGREPCHSLVLTASAAHASVQNAGYGLGAAAWTFEFWLRVHGGFAATPTAPPFILQTNEDFGEYAIYIQYDPERGLVDGSTWAVTDTAGKLRAKSRPINDGRWHHVAWTYGAGTMTVFTDGNPGATDMGVPDLRESSPMSIGKPRGYPGHVAAPVALGPIRISRNVRYVGRFDPRQDWAVDSDTVSQHQVTSGLSNGVLTDEAGGDNPGSDFAEIEAETAARCR